MFRPLQVNLKTIKPDADKNDAMAVSCGVFKSPPAPWVNTIQILFCKYSSLWFKAVIFAVIALSLYGTLSCT